MAVNDKSIKTNVSVTGDLTTSGLLNVTASSGIEGGEIRLAAPAAANTSINTAVNIDIYGNKLRFWESGGTNRGYYVDITAGAAGAGTSLTGGTTGSMNYAQTLGTKQSAISSAGTTIVSVSITTNGYPVLVSVTGDVENNSAGGWTTLQLYRGSTAIGNIVHTEGSAASENSPFALQVVDSPAAGTYTYALKLNSSAGGTFNFGESNGPVITALELSGPKGDTGSTGANGTSPNAFTTIATTSGTSPVADSTSDTLTLSAGAGSGITVTGDATTDTVTIGTNATSANGASTLVIRDASGNFAGETITATTFSGSGASLTNIPGANVTGTLTSTVLGNSTAYIGTTAVALNRASGNQALTGISSITLPGSVSGTVQLIPAATVGTGTVLTIPPTTGNVITSGDTATVTNTMLAGAIQNAKLANVSVALGSQTLTLGAAATTALSGLTGVSSTTFTSTVLTGTAPFTVASTTLVTNLNADLLDGYSPATTNTINSIVLRDASGNFAAGTITAATFSGSGASLTSIPAANVTGTLTSTVLGNSTLYVGNTAVALNRAQGNQALTGISSVTLPGSTSGTVQLIPSAVAGTGTVITLPATTGNVVTTGDTATITGTMLVNSTVSNAKLANASVSLGAQTLTLGAAATTALTGMTGITFSGSTSGTAQIVPAAVAGTGTVLTLPATTGTVALTSDIPTVNNGTLTLAVSGVGLSGSASFTANQSGATTFTVASNASDANGATTIVSRDAFGSFSANNITGNLFIGSGGSLTGLNGSNVATGTVADARITSTLTGKTYNGLTLTAGTTGFTVAGGTTSKTLNVVNTLTFAGTDSTTMTFPSSSSTVMTLAQPGTLTGSMTLRAGSTTSATAPLYFVSGGPLATPEAGAMEYTSGHLYYTGVTTSGRGSLPTQYHYSLAANANYTLATNNTNQSMFPALSSGLPLESGVRYEIEGTVVVSHTVTTITNGTVTDVLSTSFTTPTLTYGWIDYSYNTGTSATFAAGAVDTVTFDTATTSIGTDAIANSISRSTTGTNSGYVYIRFRGHIKTSASGSLLPKIKFNFTDAGGVGSNSGAIQAGSWMKVVKVPETVGAWA